MTEKVSQLIDLNKDELKVYEISVARGYVTASMISKIYKKGEKILSIVDSLEKKGFLKKIPGIVPRYVPISPVKDFLAKLNEFDSELDNINGQITGIKEKEQEAANSLKAEATQVLDNSISSVLSSTSTARESATGVISEQIKNFKENITSSQQKTSENLLNQEKPALELFQKQNNDAITTVEADLSAEINENTTQLKTVLDTLKKSLVAQQDGIKKNFDLGAKTLLKDSTAIKKDIKTQIDALNTQTLNSYSNIQQIMKENAGNSANTVSQAFKTAEEASKNTITGVSNNIDALLKTALADVKKSIDESHSEISNAQQNIKNSLESAQTTLIDKIQTGTNDIIADNTTKTTTIKTDLSQKAKKIVSSSIESIKTSNNEWEQELTKQLTQGIKILKDGGFSLKDAIAKSIQNEVQRYKTEVTTALAKIQEDYLTRIGQAGDEYETALKNTINDKVVDFSDALKKTSEQLSTENQEKSALQEKSISDLGSELDLNINQTCDGIDKQFQSLLQENMDKNTETIKTSYTQALETTEESMTSTLSILEQNNQKMETGITKNQTTVSSSLTAESQKLSSTVEERVSKLQKLTEDTLTTQNTIIQGAITKINEEITLKINAVNSSIDKANQSLNQAIEKFNTELNPNIEGITAKINELFNPMVSKLNTFLESLKKSFITAGQTIQSTYSKTLNGSSEFISAEIKQFETDVSEVFSKSQETITEAFKQLGVLTDKASNEIKTAINDTIVKVQDSMFDEISKVSDNMGNVLNSEKQAIVSPKEVLSDVWSEFIDKDMFDAEKTWILVGQDSILEFIKGMIERTKSSSFILVPKFEDVDWKQIMDIHSKGRKFLVCSQLETAKDGKTLTKVFDSGIDLYQYAEKDFIACIRDNEEILISPVSPEEDETTAIISETTPMIKHFSSMFGDYWRRVGKKYQPR